MKTKILIILILFLILLCSVIYADVYGENSTFTPTESNVTYNITRNLVCDDIIVWTRCFNITGGDDAYNYCNESVTDIYIYILAPPVIGSYEPLANPTIHYDVNYIFNVSTYDTDGDVSVYSWRQNGTVVGVTENHTFEANYSSIEDFNITMIVSDDNGSNQHEWVLTVTDLLNPECDIVQDNVTVEVDSDDLINWTTYDFFIDSTIFNVTYSNGSIVYESSTQNDSVEINFTALDNYTIFLYVNDTYGNENITNDTFETFDNTAPLIFDVIENLPDPITAVTTRDLNITFNVTDVFLDNVSAMFNNNNETVLSLGNDSYRIALIDLPPDYYVYNFTANDTYGNIRIYHGTFTINYETSSTGGSGGSGATRWCGDGLCNGLETSKTCPKDCIYISTCGNQICEPIEGENSVTCLVDCPIEEYIIVESNETLAKDIDDAIDFLTNQTNITKNYLVEQWVEHLKNGDVEEIDKLSLWQRIKMWFSLILEMIVGK